MASTDLVVLADVATHLNWSSAETTKYTAPMTRFISASTAIIEGISGPVVQRTFDEWYSGGRSRIQLDNYPVVGNPTLVTEAWAASLLWTLTPEPLDGSVAGDAYGYTIDQPSGLLVRRMMGNESNFATGTRNVHVQYTAGMCASTASVPPNIALAALELIRINWQPVQGGNVPSYGGAGGTDALDVSASVPAGFFVPPRVMEILKPNANRFGIA